MKLKLFLLPILLLAACAQGAQSLVELPFRSKLEMAAYPITGYQTNLAARISGNSAVGDGGETVWYFAPGDSTATNDYTIIASAGTAGRWRYAVGTSYAGMRYYSTNLYYGWPTAAGEMQFLGPGGVVGSKLIGSVNADGDGWPTLTDAAGAPATNTAPSDAELLNTASAKRLFVPLTNSVGYLPDIGVAPVPLPATNSAAPLYGKVADGRTRAHTWSKTGNMSPVLTEEDGGGLYQGGSAVLTNLAGIGAGTAGDIIYRDANRWTNATVGAEGEVLTVSGGLPVWQVVNGTEIQSLATLDALRATTNWAIPAFVTDTNRGGLFAYTTTAHATNAGTIYEAVGVGSGRWVRHGVQFVSPNWLGAETSSSTSSNKFNTHQYIIDSTAIALSLGVNKVTFTVPGEYWMTNRVYLYSAHSGAILDGAGTTLRMVGDPIVPNDGRHTAFWLSMNGASGSETNNIPPWSIQMRNWDLVGWYYAPVADPLTTVDILYTTDAYRTAAGLGGSAITIYKRPSAGGIFYSTAYNTLTNSTFDNITARGFAGLINTYTLGVNTRIGTITGNRIAEHLLSVHPEILTDSSTSNVYPDGWMPSLHVDTMRGTDVCTLFALGSDAAVNDDDHGSITINRVIGKNVFGRTKIQENYRNVHIGTFEVDRCYAPVTLTCAANTAGQYAGEGCSWWPALEVTADYVGNVHIDNFYVRNAWTGLKADGLTAGSITIGTYRCDDVYYPIYYNMASGNSHRLNIESIQASRCGGFGHLNGGDIRLQSYTARDADIPGWSRTLDVATNTISGWSSSILYTSPVTKLTGNANWSGNVNIGILRADDCGPWVDRQYHSKVARSSDVATVTTSWAHGYQNGDYVVVDASDNTFDDSAAVVTVTTSTNFTYVNVGADVGAKTDTGNSVPYYSGKTGSTARTYSGLATWASRVRIGKLIATETAENSAAYWLLYGATTEDVQIAETSIEADAALNVLRSGYQYVNFLPAASVAIDLTVPFTRYTITSNTAFTVSSPLLATRRSTFLLITNATASAYTVSSGWLWSGTPVTESPPASNIKIRLDSMGANESDVIASVVGDYHQYVAQASTTAPTTGDGYAGLYAADDASAVSQIRVKNESGTINQLSGNVGIGTVAPPAPLSIFTSSNATGGIIILDNDAATAGNARGAGAVDLQWGRNGATKVASGRNSVAAGTNCVVSGLAAVGLGWEATATGDYTFAAGGINPKATGSGAVALGRPASSGSSGSGSFTQGVYVDATGAYASASGFRVIAPLNGQFARGSGYFSAVGDAQMSILTARAVMTPATSTVTNLYLDGTSSYPIALPANSSWIFRAEIVGRTTDAGTGDEESGAYTIQGLIERDDAAANTRIVGSVTVTTIAEDDAAWDVTATADTTNGALTITVTGNNETTIRWVGTIYLTQVGG